MREHGRTRTTNSLLAAVALAAALGVCLAQRPQPAPPPRATPATIRATIDVSRSGDPINPLLYGHFIELLRNWFEHGMWAEMIGDRKFFYPVNNDPAQTPPNGRRNLYGRWSPIGPQDRVAMDPARAYSGDHAPRIRLDASTPYGSRSRRWR
jgi:alpha-L-arabinofuranosidase